MDLSELQAVEYCFESNSSCLKEVRSPAVYVVMYISAAAVVMLTVCGNLVVIISISHFKQLHTPTNFLMLSLAVADFLVGIAVMPFCLILLIETCWYFGDIFCMFYNLFVFFLTSVSISNVACIAIDRYFAVCYPLLYSTKVTVNITSSVILLSWLISLLYNLAFMYFNGNIGGAEKMTICLGDCLLFNTKSWVVIDLIFTLILPCSVMITLYFKIFIVARKHARAINSVTEQMCGDAGSNKISAKSERKAAKTLGILVIVFLLCLVPYYICCLVLKNVDRESTNIVLNLLCWLLYFNSAINPIIYALFYPWFQKSVKLIVTLKIFKIESSLISVFSKQS
ncbi:trace amine-associated receptor 13c-like [Lepisosteus oculatus]|uniref:trace amine-associated receptor 13c-like n=1 Tax=Lepisosteus oculatus TaxID=7918 RepID=UPI0035F51ECD